MPDVVSDIAVARAARQAGAVRLPRRPSADRPGSMAAPGERIATTVALVEDTLTRRLDEVQAAWDRTPVDDGVGAESNLPRQLRDLLDRGGKRTRPVMVALGWIAAGARDDQNGYDDMVLAAAAVEMLHCFALVHDDVMDESPVRRGHPTLHEQAAERHRGRRGLGASARYGDNVAMLAGDLAHSEADRLAASLPVSMRDIWQQLVLELLAGQVADIVGSSTGDRRLGFARVVARQKTGYYTVARPLQLGAVAAGAGTDVLGALADYGRHAGEAFALRDDILGAFGDPGATGKPAGDDIRAGKPTALLALAAESLGGAAAAALRRAGTPELTDDDLRVVRDAMVERGVLAAVEAMIDHRVNDALAAIATPALAPAGVSELTRVVDDLARRGR